MTPITILMLDEPLHTDLSPFCSDGNCPCHDDPELMCEQITLPWYRGLLTREEAKRLYTGRQLITEQMTMEEDELSDEEADRQAAEYERRYCSAGMQERFDALPWRNL